MVETLRPKRRGLLASLVSGLLILVIAAIAIPNLMRSRISPGESSPVGSVRTVNTACVTYTSTYPERGFPKTLKQLGPPPDGSKESAEAAGLIDPFLASGRKQGYLFIYQVTDINKDGVVVGYAIHADPLPEEASWLQRLFGVMPQTGTKHFFSDQSTVIRSENGRPASANSPPLS